jgi:5-methylcytosine-specific restriction endonuclease McrA
MSLARFRDGELDERESDLSGEEERAAEWEFRLENDLVDSDVWRSYCAARAESWIQDELKDMCPDARAALVADLERSEHAAAEVRAAHAERRSELRAMPYREYLRTPEWRERREAVLIRAGRRCYVCNANTSLHVHHRTYERRGSERDDDLVVLCWRCHGHFHEHLDLAR